LTVLDTAELKRRMEAARILRGFDQVDLGRLLHEEGFGKLDAGRLERGAIPLTRAHRRALAMILEVPESWFTDDHVVIPEPGDPAIADKLDQLLAERETLLAEIDKQNHLLDEQSGLLRRIEALVRVLEGAVIEPGAAEPDVPLPGLPLPSERDAQEQTRPERTTRDPDRRRSNRRRESA
jgi:transcriptional regulator with XRE-family HTH domain